MWLEASASSTNTHTHTHRVTGFIWFFLEKKSRPFLLKWLFSPSLFLWIVTMGERWEMYNIFISCKPLNENKKMFLEFHRKQDQVRVFQMDGPWIVNRNKWTMSSGFPKWNFGSSLHKTHIHQRSTPLVAVRRGYKCELVGKWRLLLIWLYAQKPFCEFMVCERVLIRLMTVNTGKLISNHRTDFEFWFSQKRHSEIFISLVFPGWDELTNHCNVSVDDNVSEAAVLCVHRAKNKKNGSKNTENSAKVNSHCFTSRCLISPWAN